MDKSKKNPREQAVEAALKLAADRGWPAVGLEDIAAATGLTMAALHDLFEDRLDILTAFGRMIDRETLETADPSADGTSPRDRLFDLLMRRFDALTPYKAGVASIISSCMTDPKQVVISLPHLCRSMTWILEAAGIGTGGLKGVARVAGLSGLYLKTARIWVADDTADLSKTMAELDKNLARAEQWASTFGLADTIPDGT